jgi:curved DNA-binding protein CbpA
MTYYDILQVSESAEAKVIRAAYKALCQEWHPDKNPGNEELASQHFQLLNEAYTVLADPGLRSEHDQEIRQRRAHQIAAGSQTSPIDEQPDTTVGLHWESSATPPASFANTLGILFWAASTTLTWILGLAYLIASLNAYGETGMSGAFPFAWPVLIFFACTWFSLRAIKDRCRGDNEDCDAI